MEDDDEFRDLYMDVLWPFTSMSSSSDALQPHGVSLHCHLSPVRSISTSRASMTRSFSELRVELLKRAPPEDVKFDIEEVNIEIYDACFELIISRLSGALAMNIEASTADND
jgi:hypothetical protein